MHTKNTFVLLHAMLSLCKKSKISIEFDIDDQGTWQSNWTKAFEKM